MSSYAATESVPVDGIAGVPASPEGAPNSTAFAAIIAESVAGRGHGTYEAWDEQGADGGDPASDDRDRRS